MVLVITHAKCQDGFTCKTILQAKYADIKVIETFPGNGFDLDLISESNDIIYIADIAFSIEIMDEIAKRTDRLIIIDHHKTNERTFAEWQSVPDNVDIIFDMRCCAAVLTWKWCNPATDIPSVISYVNDRDIWLWQNPHSREINRGMYELGVFEDIEYMRTLFKYSKEQLYEEFFEIGKTKIEKDNQVMDQLMENFYLRRYTFMLRRYQITFVDDCPADLRSDMGNRLAAKSKDGIGATWRKFEDDTIGISVRRIGDAIDLTAIGFGGHPAAAGMSVPANQFEKLFSKV